MKRPAATFVNLMAFAGAAMAGQQPTTGGTNPMWASGYQWNCEAVFHVSCERDAACKQEAGKRSIFLDYEKSLVIIDNVPASIKRHYAQSVDGNPLGPMVTVETDNRFVFTLIAVDPSTSFSKDWIGMMTRPQGGVVIVENWPVSCRPK